MRRSNDIAAVAKFNDQESSDEDDDWVPISSPAQAAGSSVPVTTTSNTRSTTYVTNPSISRVDYDTGGDGDVDILKEIIEFAHTLLLHMSESSPILLLAALLQCLSLYLYVCNYAVITCAIVATVVYLHPTVLQYLEKVVDRKQLNKVVFFILVLYYTIFEIKSTGYLLHCWNVFIPLIIYGNNANDNAVPVWINVGIHSLLYALVTMCANDYSQELNRLYLYVKVYLYIAVLMCSYYFPFNDVAIDDASVVIVNRDLLAANFFGFLARTIVCDSRQLKLYDNIIKSIKSYSLRKLEEMAKSKENSIKLFTFILDFLTNDATNQSNNEFNLDQELRKVDVQRLDHDFRNYEKIVRNLEVTNEFHALFYIRNSVAMLAFLGGYHRINIASIILIVLEVVLVIHSIDNGFDTFFGEMKNIGTLHVRFLTSLKVYQGVIVSVSGYQTTMAVYDAFVAVRSLWGLIGSR